MKKIFLVAALGFISLFAAGCTAENSASAVAENFAKQIKKGNYEKAKELIYKQDEGFYTDDTLNHLIENYEAKFGESDSIEVASVGHGVENEDGIEVVAVELQIYDHEKLIVNTAKIDGEWYIYENIYYGDGVNVIVPEGYTLEVDWEDKTGDSLEQISAGYKISHPNDEKIYVELNDVNSTIYVIEKYTSNVHEITLKGEKYLSDIILTASDCGNVSSDKYEQQCSESIPAYYDFNEETLDTTDIKLFVKKYINEHHTGIDKKYDFSKIEYLYDESIRKSVKDEYDIVTYWLSHASYVEPLDSAYYSDYKLESLNFKDIKYFDDNNIVVVGNYGVKYLYNKKTANNTLEKDDYYNDYKLVLSLKKSGDTYVVTNRLALFLGGE